MSLQEGIYYDNGSRPGSCWGVLFLRVRPGTDSAEVDTLLTGLSAVYNNLRQGLIADLPGVQLPSGDLTVLYGFGPKAFAILNARRQLPVGLGANNQFGTIAAGGGGTLVTGSGVRYASGIARNAATEEVMIQAIGNTQLSVARVFVETEKYLRDHPSPVTGVPNMELAAGFTGFNRDDRRSWINFHDGISNLSSGAERGDAITIKNAGTPVADRWTVGGTYLCFIRLSVDLKQWHLLAVEDQERSVGRSKLSGCPLVATNTGGIPQSLAGCPVGATSTVTDSNGDNSAFFEPPQIGDVEVLKSHVQRANHHLGPIDRDSSRRIFRQGYEFITPPQPGTALQQGLNFVSFQDTLSRVFFILTQPGWLGDVNFGGPVEMANEPLLSAIAAGGFLCPPSAGGEAYPGQSIFI